MRPCKVEGCKRLEKAKLLCQWHYTLDRENDPSRPKCLDESCDRRGINRGLCTKHYQRKRRGFVPPSPFCSVEGCDRPRKALGWCMRHYDRKRLHGDLEALADVVDCTDCGVGIVRPPSGTRTTCVECSYKRSRALARESRWRHLLWEKYRIREADYFSLLKSQGGVCAICGGPPKGQGEINGRYSVDHDHETGAVRGLLCSPCNTGIGHLKDSADLVAKALAYLSVSRKE